MCHISMIVIIGVKRTRGDSAGEGMQFKSVITHILQYAIRTTC